MSLGGSINSGLTGYFSNLVATAKREKFWIYGKRKGIEYWFSPIEFNTKLHNGGEWISEVIWILRSPKERVSELKFLMEENKKEIENISETYYNENKEL